MRITHPCSAMRRLVVKDDDQARLQREFHDDRLRYGRNPVTGKCEVWYVPDRSPEYRVCECHDICHAIRIVGHKAMQEKQKIQHLVRKLDEENERNSDREREAAMHTVRKDLANMQAGRQIFLT